MTASAAALPSQPVQRRLSPRTIRLGRVLGDYTAGVTSLRPYRRPLIFGGSFDPPHLAHLELPRAVAEQIDADVVVYVPAGRAPHKLDKTQTPAHHRLAMLELAMAQTPGCVIRTDELKRAADGRPSYTVDTLEVFASELAEGATMRLLIGMDQVRIFETWKDWQRVERLAEPVVMRRREPGVGLGGEHADPVADAELADLSDRWRKRIVDVPYSEISSTEVRQRVTAGRSIDALVPAGVAGYIQEHGLYRASSEED